MMNWSPICEITFDMIVNDAVLQTKPFFDINYSAARSGFTF